jgi:hypothetical protein
MKKLSIILLMLLLTSCTLYMYGVPQEQWDRMSEPERIRTRELYEREQQARRQAAEEQARRQAYEREQEQARQAAMQRARLDRIEAIHRGEGAYGELIRVRLQGGLVKIGDRYYRYEPITFTIADDETRDIAALDRNGREVILNVAYSKGALSLAGLRLPYDRSWGRGRLYPNTSTAGRLELKGVDIFVEVHDRSSRHERMLHRLLSIREELPPTPPPPPVQIRPHDTYKKPPVYQPPPPPVADRMPHLLELVLLGGEMKVHGKYQPLEQVMIRIAEGESRSLPIKAWGKSESLTIRYQNGELQIDGTPGKGHDDLRLPYDREWKSGKLYRFDLRGRLHLERVEMKVRGL